MAKLLAIRIYIVLFQVILTQGESGIGLKSQVVNEIHIKIGMGGGTTTFKIIFIFGRSPKWSFRP